MKKLIVAMLCALLCVSLALSVVACKSENITSDVSTDSSSSSSSPAIDSTPDSSSEKEPDPVVVERGSVNTTVLANASAITVGNIVGAVKGESDPVAMLLGGINVGDLVKFVGGDLLAFNYYNDGYWRMGTGVKFGDVENVIFNYEIASSKPLGLTAAQLTLYGDTSVFDLYAQMFFPMMRPAVLRQQISQTIGTDTLVDFLCDMTVSDLYNVTARDYTYFGTIKVDTILNSINAVIKLYNAQSESVIMLTPSAVAAMDGISEMYGTVTVAGLENAVMTTPIADYIELCRAIMMSEIEDNATAQAIANQVFDDMKTLLTGTLANVSFNAEADIAEIIAHYVPETVLPIADIREILDDTAVLITSYGDKDFIDIAVQYVIKYVTKYTPFTEEQVSATIDLVAGMIYYLTPGNVEAAELPSAVVNFVTGYIASILKLTEEQRVEMASTVMAFVTNDTEKLRVISESFGSMTVGQFDDMYLNSFMGALIAKLGLTANENVVAFMNLSVYNVILTYSMSYSFIAENGWEGLVEYVWGQITSNAQAIRSTTIAQIDTYLNGVISKFVTEKLGETSLLVIMNLTLGDISDNLSLKMLDTMFFDGQIGKVLGADNAIMDITLTMLISNFGAYAADFMQFVTTVKNDFFTLTFAEMDAKYFEGKIAVVLASIDFDWMLDYTVEDYASLTSELPNEELLAKIESINIMEVVQLVISMVAPSQEVPELVAA